MKKENKYISQPLAKRLAALGELKGVESEYLWFEGGQKTKTPWKILVRRDSEEAKTLIGGCPAYDTTELGEWLKSIYKISQYYFSHGYNGTEFYSARITVDEDGLERERRNFFAHTEPEARGLMAEYLLKNKLV